MGDDPRTPQQRAADEALEAAINAVRDAYGYSDDGSFVTNYVTVYASAGLEPGSEGFGQLVTNGHMPPYLVRGMLGEALAKLDH